MNNTRNVNDPPQWYRDAIKQTPETGSLGVDGANIDWSAWGERGRPGLMLLIGNGAHMGWWRPIAPILARDYRVVTFNWSGMGSSDWREKYSISTFVEEALDVATAAGLFQAQEQPYIAAHSLGGFFGLHLLVEHGERFGGGILVDSRLRLGSLWSEHAVPTAPFHAHETQEDAIARFRLLPEQPAQNEFILRMLAEESVGEVQGGWRFRQDPDFRRKMHLDQDLVPLIPESKCPLAFVRGALTKSVSTEIWLAKQAIAPAGTPFVEIPGAHHHVMVDQPLKLVATIRALLLGFGNDFAGGTERRISI